MLKLKNKIFVLTFLFFLQSNAQSEVVILNEELLVNIVTNKKVIEVKSKDTIYVNSEDSLILIFNKRIFSMRMNYDSKYYRIELDYRKPYFHIIGIRKDGVVEHYIKKGVKCRR